MAGEEFRKQTSYQNWAVEVSVSPDSVMVSKKVGNRTIGNFFVYMTRRQAKEVAQLLLEGLEAVPEKKEEE